MIYNLPRAKIKGEKWIINDILQNYSSDTTTFGSIKVEGINFISNGKHFSSMGFYISSTHKNCTYDDTVVTRDAALMPSKKALALTWLSDAYKRVTFFEAPTGDLLAWLRVNAVKLGADESDVSSWSVSDISGASYKFALNSKGYYESNNKGVDNSAAVCRVKIHAAKACTVTFKCINYAESSYDFGLLGTLDKALDTGYSDVSTNVAKSFKGSSYASEQTYAYTNVAKGDHFIDVKYRKDSSQSSNNDTLQFKVEIS